MIRRLFVASLCSAWLLAAPADGAPVTVGPVTAYEIKTNLANGTPYVEVTMGSDGYAEVVPFAPDVVRVRYHFAGLYEREELAIAKPFSNWPPVSVTFTPQGSTNLVLMTSQLRVDIVLSNRFAVHFSTTNGLELSRDKTTQYDVDYTPIGDSVGYQQIVWPSGSASISNLPAGFKLKATRTMPTNEAYFGAGDFAGPLNRRGATIQGWGQDCFQWEEYRNPKYVSLPFFYGVRPADSNRPVTVYGLFFHNPVRPVFKFNGGSGDQYSFEAGDDQLDYFFFGGGTNQSAYAVLDRYSELTGRPFMLPKWALGYQHSRNANDLNTQNGVQSTIQSFRDQDYPIDAVYLDINAQNMGSQNHQLTLNSTFTNVPSMVTFASNLGVRLVPIIEPLLTTNDPMYEEAFTNLYFLKNNNLSTYVGTNFLGKISWIDFSISDARTWWIGKITNYLAATKFDGIWNDLNEPNENGMKLNILHFLDGRYGGGLVTNDSRKWHSNIKNTYSVMECSLSYDALRAQYPDRRPFVLSRSGWPGIARYSAGWSGDNVASYDHLRHNIRAGLSVMVSGQPYFGHDIGGFSGNVTGDLMSRWFQMATLQPVFRNHTLSANREPWLFGPVNADWNKRWMKYRYRMLPHLYSLAALGATNGVPLNVPTFFEFPGDVNTYSLNDYDFLVGPNLLAAPVYAQSATARQVYLPFGANWFFLEYDSFHLGGQSTTFPASMGTLPMFVREGTILPMGPDLDYADQVASNNYLDLHVWPRAPGWYTLYEDDGTTTNYLAGQWCSTRFSNIGGSNSIQFAVEPRLGTYTPAARDYYFVLHAASNPVSVAVNGQSVRRYANRGELEAFATNGWCMNYPARLLTVKTPDTAGSITVDVTFDPRTDSDGDGMPDAWELAYGGNTTTLVATNNPDGDARDNLAEYGAGSNPLFADSFTSAYSNVAVAGSFTYWNEAARNMRLVSNGLWAAILDLSGWTNIEFKFVANDQWTNVNWGDGNPTNYNVPLVDIADVSADNILATGSFSGVYAFLFNESNLHYSLRSAASTDADRDGLPDAWEFTNGLSPLVHADAALDADSDGLANSNEYLLGSSPVAQDSDGDQVSDGNEWVAGTSPTNASSYFVIAQHSLSSTNGAIEVRWSAVTGRWYDVYSTTGLLQASWGLFNPFTNLSGSGPLTIVDTNPVPERQYRVRVRLQ